MDDNHPLRLPALFVKSTSLIHHSSIYVPISIPVPAYHKLPRANVFNEIQKKLVEHADKFGMYKQSERDLRENLKSVRAVLMYLAYREPQVRIRAATGLTQLTVTYPNGVLISATQTPESLESIRGSVVLGRSDCTLFYTVSHHQWPELDISSYVDDWSAFNRCLTVDVSRPLAAMGLKAVFETFSMAEHGEMRHGGTSLKPPML